MQPGTFDLVGRIVYEVDQLAYQNTFYNATIEVTEAGGLVSIETIFTWDIPTCPLWIVGS